MRPIARRPTTAVVAFVAPKGGVGKTSTTANVAACAVDALRPRRVLAVDLDESGDLAHDLGYRDGPADDRGAALAGALLRGKSPQPSPTARAGLDVLAGGERLGFAAHVQSCLASNATRALHATLRRLGDDYALVVVDCPPGLGPMTRLALAAAGGAIIPARADDASLAAIGALAAIWRDTRAHHNYDLQLLGIALTQIPAGARRLETQLRDDLHAMSGSALRVFATSIRSDPQAACEARRLRLTAADYAEHVARHADHPATDPRARVARGLADDYRHLTSEILRQLDLHRTHTTPGDRP